MIVVLALALAALGMLLTLDGWWLLLVAIPALPALALLVWIESEPAPADVAAIEDARRSPGEPPPHPRGCAW